MELPVQQGHGQAEDMGREGKLGGWKVITCCCTVSAPMDNLTSHPLRVENSPQWAWGQILF